MICGCTRRSALLYMILVTSSNLAHASYDKLFCMVIRDPSFRKHMEVHREVVRFTTHRICQTFHSIYIYISLLDNMNNNK
jgi:hypothetical protein